MYQNGIEVIQNYIVKDAVALRKWPDCIYSFVADASSRMRLIDEFDGYWQVDTHAQVITKTLEEWIAKRGNSATFGI